LFVGDIGNEVTTEMLIAVFSQYPHFNRAKVKEAAHEITINQPVI